MTLSNESQKFIGNLRAYLLSSGKREQEIDEITEELEDHLHEAEQSGKSVEDIIGQSPKEYMKQFEDEMAFDYQWIYKIIPLIYLGAVSYILIQKVLDEGVVFTLLELVGYPVIFMIVILSYALTVRYISSHQPGKSKEWLLFGTIGIVQAGLFIGILFLDDAINSPEFDFGMTGNVIAVIFAVAMFIGMAIWSKVWIPIILPIILFVPDFLIRFIDVGEPTETILSSSIVLSITLLYFFILIKIDKTKGTAA
ncbi:hypothetical protein [Halobacillus sp. BBL2006]|uniref:HAAS domain-containing protein n=1 Tax=Halobacillus sp. BBL2006 TaxID=1543706 RepID=UPI0005437790|nr:hypothetical protein [Halobacillus sp. BBL2006]KHE69767.1 hypothetical protein LD39_12430 [Halobacillus sp. BBL2006]